MEFKGSSSESLIAKGIFLEVHWYYQESGRCNAKKFFDMKLPKKSKEEFLFYCKILAELGDIGDSTKFKRLEENLYELKPYGYRFIGFYHENEGKFFIVNESDRKKKKKEFNKNNLPRARRLRADFWKRNLKNEPVRKRRKKHE